MSIFAAGLGSGNRLTHAFAQSIAGDKIGVVQQDDDVVSYCVVERVHAVCSFRVFQPVVSSMHFRPRSTAQQLKSVAYRYSNGFCDAPKDIRGMFLYAGIRGTDRVQEAVGPNVRDHRLQRLESVLFLAREPLTSRKLSQYANLADGTESRTLIRRLNELYDKSGRTFRVERVAGGYQLLTRPRFASWIRRLEYVPRETRLSAPAMETLAVVAYRQPVLRADVEAIRGVGCGEVLRQLMERNLVRIGGRSDELGRPYLYTTTKHFLRTFGLENLDGLPCVAAIREDGEQRSASSEDQADLHNSASSGENETAQNDGEELNMPVSTRSDVAVDENQDRALLDQLAAPQLASTFDDDEDNGDFFDEEEDYDEFDDEDDEDEDDLQDEWEEVEDDDTDWSDDEDSDWSYDDEDEEDEELD